MLQNILWTIIKTLSEEIRRHCLKIENKFRVIYDIKKYSFCCNVKGKIPSEQKHHVIYRLTCIVNIERCLLCNMDEHGTRDAEPIFKDFSECKLLKEFCSYYALLLVNIDNTDKTYLHMPHIYNPVLHNNDILDIRYWILITTEPNFYFLEVFYIKKYDPMINYDRKASKELS